MHHFAGILSMDRDLTFCCVNIDYFFSQNCCFCYKQNKPLITKGKPVAPRLKKAQKLQKVHNVYTATVTWFA